VVDNTRDSELEETELTELPPMPLEIGNQLVVESLGEFKIPSAQYPVGFVSRREYFPAENPVEDCCYESSTEVGSDGKLSY
jgi:hypothetical protein